MDFHSFFHSFLVLFSMWTAGSPCWHGRWSCRVDQSQSPGPLRSRFVMIRERNRNGGWIETQNLKPSKSYAGWWFGCHEFYFPIYWVANHPNWLSYFSEGWPNHQPDMKSSKWCNDVMLYYHHNLKPSLPKSYEIIWNHRHDVMFWYVLVLDSARNRDLGVAWGWIEERKPSQNSDVVTLNFATRNWHLLARLCGWNFWTDLSAASDKGVFCKE